MRKESAKLRWLREDFESSRDAYHAVQAELERAHVPVTDEAWATVLGPLERIKDAAYIKWNEARNPE